MIYISTTHNEHGQVSHGTLDNPLELPVNLAEVNARVYVERMAYVVANNESPNENQNIKAYLDVKAFVRSEESRIKIEVSLDRDGAPGKYGPSISISNNLNVNTPKVIPIWVKASIMDDGTIANKNFIEPRIEISATVKEA